MRAPVGPPRWSPERDAWVLSRFRDVVDGLRDVRLSAGNPRGDSPAGAVDESAHREARATVLAALSRPAVAAWRAQFEPLAARWVEALPTDRQVDLVGELADPLSLALAVAVTGVDGGDERRLTALARDIFAAAAEPCDGALRPRGERATVELSHAVRHPVDVQTFVALSQTLPCFLGAAWRALIEHPAELALLLAEPLRMPAAIEELLRFAGPSQAQLRRASAAVSIGGHRIAAGDRVILMLAAANRDPDRWPDSDRLDLRRDTTGHVAFGLGAYACPGAPVIRMAAAVATAALAPRLAGATASAGGAWRGGSAIGGPASLHVCVSGARS